MGHGGRPRPLHRLRSVCRRLPCREQHPDGGQDQAARGRAKHWIRVERYWEGEFPNARSISSRCCASSATAAPCEPVCPTYASYHTAEGLNAQVYNRCIGTRFCANACPYNVRFFNFFNPVWDKPLQLQLNPDVSVREVGVMEKCTFCVQRIRGAEIQAEAEKREMKDGEFNPACVQSCSPKAMVFGDLNDPTAKCRAWRNPLAARSCWANSARCRTSPIWSAARNAMQKTAATNPARSAAAAFAHRPRYYAAVAILRGRGSGWRVGFGDVPDLPRHRCLGPELACVFWAFDITNFVFWIGISHAGTLISAILRLANATWRRPSPAAPKPSRCFALSIGAIIPLISHRPSVAVFLLDSLSEPSARSGPISARRWLWDFFAIIDLPHRQRQFPAPAHDSRISRPSATRPPDGAKNSTARCRSAGRVRRGNGTGSKPPCTSWPSRSFPWPCRCTRSCPGISP